MTTVEEGDHIAGKGRRLPRAVATFAVFLVVGPLVGGGTIFLALLALKAVPPDFAHDPGAALFYSCLTLLLPVVVVGALIAFRQAMALPVAATLAAALGAVAGVIWGLFLASEGATAALSTLTFVGATVATLACWWLTRLFVGPQ